MGNLANHLPIIFYTSHFRDQLFGKQLFVSYFSLFLFCFSAINFQNFKSAFSNKLQILLFPLRFYPFNLFPLYFSLSFILHFMLYFRFSRISILSSFNFIIYFLSAQQLHSISVHFPFSCLPIFTFSLSSNSSSFSFPAYLPQTDPCFVNLHPFAYFSR